MWDFIKMFLNLINIVTCSSNLEKYFAAKLNLNKYRQFIFSIESCKHLHKEFNFDFVSNLQTLINNIVSTSF